MSVVRGSLIGIVGLVAVVAASVQSCKRIVTGLDLHPPILAQYI